MVRFVASVALVLSLAACDSQADLVSVNVSDLSHEADALVGTWDLITTTSPGMGAPPATVPVASGTETYVFGADGSVEHYRRGDLVEATTWTLRPAGPMYPGAPPSLVIGTRREYFGIDGDRLYFDDRPMDGSLAEYARR